MFVVDTAQGNFPMSRPRDLIHPRDAIMRTMERIYRYRMTTTSGGNLSIQDEDGSLWITPARVDKGSLRRDDIVRVRADGTADGPHRPSSEFPFHKAIYEARPDLRGIVHAHPVALVAFSICRRVPDTRGEGADDQPAAAGQIEHRVVRHRARGGDDHLQGSLVRYPGRGAKRGRLPRELIQDETLVIHARPPCSGEDDTHRAGHKFQQR